VRVGRESFYKWILRSGPTMSLSVSLVCEHACIHAGLLMSCENSHLFIHVLMAVLCVLRPFFERCTRFCCPARENQIHHLYVRRGGKGSREIIRKKDV